MAEMNVAQLMQGAAELYEQRGFRSQVGYGKKPALLIIDLALAWTDPQYPLGSNLDAVVEATNELLAIARPKTIPIIFTTMAYDPKMQGAALYLQKIPALAGMVSGSEPTRIDPRLQPQPNEVILEKQWLSAFFGTNLLNYLINQQVDTVIITGCSTSACVRATATDALGYGFRPIVPQECVGDRAAGPHLWNLFDMDAKMADVVSKADVLQYLSAM